MYNLIRILFSLQNILGALILFSSISCSFKAEEISTDPNHSLRFSTDTIFFDTIFTEIPSITKRLRVFNDENTAVNIANISLKDPDTPYRITVNGIEGTSFEVTKILAKDSILILLKANISNRDSLDPYVVQGQLLFVTNGNKQEVSIFSWGQDANYLRDSVITCNAAWKVGKPYVLVDNVLVDSLCTLTIEPGARIFSHPGSNIYVKGSLKVLGTKEEPVLFMNDRFDGDFATFPGQWGGITFLEGSKNNEIKFAEIRNAEVGIWLGTPDDDSEPDLIIENTIIENMSESGILAFTSDLEMTNCLIDNAGQVVFGGLAGGNYKLQHNTIANYSIGFFKSQPAFIITDQLNLSDGSVIAAPVSIELNNNVIWGLDNNEIELLNEAGLEFTLTMTNNLFRSTNEDLVGFNNIINEDPVFIDPFLFNYELDSLSPALKQGADLGIFIDLLGRLRSNPPDIGAYEKQ